MVLARDIEFCVDCKKPINEWANGIGVYRFCPECRKAYGSYTREHNERLRREGLSSGFKKKTVDSGWCEQCGRYVGVADEPLECPGCFKDESPKNNTELNFDD